MNETNTTDQSTCDAHADRGHALLGGSSASRWLNCTGSIFLSKNLPPQVSSQAALDGTVAHELCEKHLGALLQHYIDGSPKPVFKHDDEVLQEAVNLYVETIWEKVFLESIVGKAWALEDRVEISTELDMFGFIDLWVIYIDDKGKRCGVIVDFKYGFHEVEAKGNSQLAYYSVALRNEIKRAGKDLDYVRAVIFQPRIFGDVYKETKFTASQLDTWERKFLAAGKKIFLDKKATFKVGSWCHFCQAQAICPKYQKDITQKTSLKLLDISTENLPTLETIPDEKILQIILNEAYIKKILVEAKKYGIARQLQGKPLANSKVVASKQRRKWIDDTNTIVDKLEATGLEDFTTVKVKSLTAVEKELKQKVGKAEAETLMEELVDYTKSSPIIVAIDDPREAMRLSSDLLIDIDE